MNTVTRASTRTPVAADGAGASLSVSGRRQAFRARRAIDDSGADVLLTGRAECYLTGHPAALLESIRRLQAYADAGADVLFAPGVHDPSDIAALVQAVAPKPLNLLVSRDIRLSVADIARLGVRRISVGPALALAAWTGVTQAAQLLASEGSFAGFASLSPYAEINGFFAADYRGAAANGRAAGGSYDRPMDSSAGFGSNQDRISGGAS